MDKVYGHRECKSLEEVVSKKDYDNRVTPIENGGTGANTSRAAEYAICNDMPEAAQAISDTHQIVYKSAVGSTTRGALIYKSASALWTYIAGKIRSTFGFSSSNVLPVANGGTGATNADTARANIGAVAKAGDTITGNVVIKKTIEDATSVTVENPNRKISLSTHANAGVYDDTNAKWVFNSPKDSTDWVFNGKAQNVTGTVAVGNGGTGATTWSAALTNLGIRRGKTATLTVGANTAKTLTVTYSSACGSTPIVVVTPVGGSSNTSVGMFTYEVYNQTTTGFSIRVVTAAGASFNNAFNYIAMIP